MPRARNSAATAKARRSRPVTARTAARRARQQQEALEAKTSTSRTSMPETMGQARVWQRKQGRYDIAGLCHTCSSHAAWGHALGFQRIPDPCETCQPIVKCFPHAGPRGSKWRKILDKLEYMTVDQLSEWLDKYTPED